MKKHNQKGFTIVELVIVIAVIAVLAAVLIPTFSNIVKKANLSNDQQNVRNMNTALAVEVIPDSKFATAGDAINGLYREGWNAGKLETYSNGFHYAYSLEKNTMYLLDETDTVIYPEESVDKSTLWGFYRDAVEAKISGITKYISFVNITNKDNFDALVGTDSYTIDLNGYFFGIDATYSNVKIINGLLVKGTVESDETVSTYEIQKIGETAAGETYTNKIFDNTGTTNNTSHVKSGTIYKDCVFYNTSVRTDMDNLTEDTTITFENCTFIGPIGGSLAAIEIYDNSNYAVDVVIKNCTFTQTERAINISGCEKATSDNDITITGCTFNGVSQEKYAALQIASKVVNVKFENNTINSLGQAVTIVRFHDSISATYTAEDLNKVVFTNNKVSNTIDSSKYVDFDGKESANNTVFEAAKSKFTASVK